MDNERIVYRRLDTSKINYLSPLGYRFFINKTPGIDFFVQRVDIPGMSLGAANQPNMFASPIPHPGDIAFDDLVVTFKVGENLEGYLEIWNWMRELGFPNEFQEYRDIVTRNDNFNPGRGEITVDGEVTIYNSEWKPTFKFTFRDLFPISISSLSMNSTDPTVTYVTATATFKYTLYNIERMTD